MKLRFGFLIMCLGSALISFPDVATAQLPKFMDRLAGGHLAKKGFKKVVDLTYVSGRICIKARLDDEEQERRFILDTYSVCLLRGGSSRACPLPFSIRPGRS